MNFELNCCPIAVSVGEAASTLSLGRTKIYELLRSGELKSRTVGRRRLISVASIHSFLEQSSGAGGSNA